MPFARRPSETERDLRASFFASEVGVTGIPAPQRRSQPPSPPPSRPHCSSRTGPPDPGVLRDAQPAACPPRRLSTQAGSADAKWGPGVLGGKGTWVWRAGVVRPRPGSRVPHAAAAAAGHSRARTLPRPALGPFQTALSPARSPSPAPQAGVGSTLEAVDCSIVPPDGYLSLNPCWPAFLFLEETWVG